MCATLFKHSCLMINSIKWVVLNVVIVNNVSNAIKFVIIFVFADEIYFLLAHLHFTCILNNPE